MRRIAVAMLIAVSLLVVPANSSWAEEPPATSTVASEARRLRAESERLEAIAAADEPRPEPREMDFGAQLLKSFFMLAGVVIFTYLVLGKGLPRVMRMTPTGRRVMIGAESRGLVEVVDRLPLEPRRILYVLKVGNSHFLVGSGEQGMTTLAKLEPEDLEAAKEIADKAARSSGFAGGLLGRLGKKEEQS